MGMVDGLHPYVIPWAHGRPTISYSGFGTGEFHHWEVFYINQQGAPLPGQCSRSNPTNDLQHFHQQSLQTNCSSEAL